MYSVLFYAFQRINGLTVGLFRHVVKRFFLFLAFTAALTSGADNSSIFSAQQFIFWDAIYSKTSL